MAIKMWRTVIRHETPTRRSVTEEFLVENDLPSSITEVDLEIDAYRPYLRACDNDGSALPFYRRTAGPAGIVVALHEGDTIPRWGLRTVLLEYVEPTEPTFRTWSLFSVPFYNQEFPPAKIGVSRRVVVLPPDDFQIALARPATSSTATGKSGKAVPVLPASLIVRKSPAIVDIAVPVPTDFQLPYAIVPDRLEAWFLRFIWFAATALTLLPLLSYLVAGAAQNYRLTSELHPLLFPVGTAIFAITIGFMTIVTNPITTRTKVALLLPFTLSVIMLVIGIANF
jgi:hypothetical protein